MADNRTPQDLSIQFYCVQLNFTPSYEYVLICSCIVT
nr:MAG TPA: hypothetical protein [Caudoviricetes sp.]